MKKVAGFLASLCLYSGVALAAETEVVSDAATDHMRPRLRYICRSHDGDTFIRVFPNSRYVEVRRNDGRPDYNMGCELSDVHWLMCTGDDGREFIFHKDGMSGVYRGSVKDTPVNCRYAGG